MKNNFSLAGIGREIHDMKKNCAETSRWQRAGKKKVEDKAEMNVSTDFFAVVTSNAQFPSATAQIPRHRRCL